MNCLACITGEVMEEPKLVKEYGIVQLFETKVHYKCSANRWCDITIMFDRKMIYEVQLGSYIEITGDLRSVKMHEDGTTRVFIYAFEIKDLIEKPTTFKNWIQFTNVTLAGNVELRRSYANKDISVANFVVEVPRVGQKRSYISCTVWNNLALSASSLDKGAMISCKGNIQSKYTKSGRLFVEVSVSYIEGKK